MASKRSLKADLLYAREKCEQKKHHPTRESAQGHADKANEHRPKGMARYQPYRCLWEPSHWHVGRRGKRANLIEMRAEDSRHHAWVEELRDKLQERYGRAALDQDDAAEG